MKFHFAKRLPHFLVFAFVFLLYGNTLTYDYTLDDLIVIKDNAFTKKGLSGIGDIFAYDSFTGFFGMEKKLVAGGRYRPLSIATFAVEYALSGGLNPFLSHLINMLLYGLTGVLIYLLLARLIKSPPGKPWHLGLPFIATLLFLAHPIHTEVVANIKGRDEILALLFSLAAMWYFLNFFEKKQFLQLALANLAFFLGLLSKENAILFVLIIPLTIHFFTKIAVKKYLPAGLSLLFTALGFIFIRFLVLGYLNSGELPKELLNNPFLDATISQKYGTIFYTLGLYIKLLFFPHPLTHDYYPYQIQLISLTDWRSLLSLAIYLGLMVYAVIKFRSRDIIAYGILFYMLTLFIVSNLFFSVGTFMNERFIYMPSLGFVIAIACLVTEKLPKIVKNQVAYRNLVTYGLLTVLLLFSVKTFTRNRVWKDNFTLFTTDVLVSENSLKCNVSAGGDYQKKAGEETDPARQAEYYENSIRHLEKAISIYPKTANGLLLYGNVLTLYRKDYKNAINQYLKILDFDPNNSNAISNTLKVMGSLDNAGELGYKVSLLKHLLTVNPDHAEVNYVLGKLYGQYKGNADSASFFLERSVGIDPGNVAVLKDLGIVYSMKGQYQKALEVFSRARELDPSDPQITQNIQITYQIMTRAANKK